MCQVFTAGWVAWSQKHILIDRTNILNRPSPRNQPSRNQFSKWPYWVFSPLFGVFYFLFTVLVIGTAWGSRGEPKPFWFDVAALLAMPGMAALHALFPIGPFLLGTLFGCGLVRFVQSIRQ
jgi:hypothetical protein